MNKLLATLVAGTFAVVASSAFAQGAMPKQDAGSGTPTPAMKKEDKKDPKGYGAAYQNPAAEKTQAEKSAAGAAEVAKTKTVPKDRPKFNEAQAQSLSSSQSQAVANQKQNVEASKALGPRKKVDISKLSKEEKQQLLRELQKESTP